MTPSHSTKGTSRYRYYVCCAAQKRGWQSCPSKAVPAGELEQWVLDQIRERLCQTAEGNGPGVWEALSPREQARMVPLMVERVDYDGPHGTLAVTFHPDCCPRLAQGGASPTHPAPALMTTPPPTVVSP